jgi:hypothetical protein
MNCSTTKAADGRNQRHAVRGDQITPTLISTPLSSRVSASAISRACSAASLRGSRQPELALRLKLCQPADGQQIAHEAFDPMLPEDRRFLCPRAAWRAARSIWPPA